MSIPVLRVWGKRPTLGKEKKKEELEGKELGTWGSREGGQGYGMEAGRTLAR